MVSRLGKSGITDSYKVSLVADEIKNSSKTSQNVITLTDSSGLINVNKSLD